MQAALIADFDLVALSPTTVVEGGTIQVRVDLTIDDSSLGTSFYFNEATNGGFKITSVDRALHPFTDFNTPTVSAITDATGGNNSLNPRNDKDLGGLAADLDNGVAAGTYNLGIYTFSTLGVTPGTYALNLGTPLQVLDLNGNDFPTILNDSLSITVNASAVPEPGSLLLTTTVVAGFFAHRRARRRKIAAMNDSPHAS